MPLNDDWWNVEGWGHVFDVIMTDEGVTDDEEQERFGRSLPAWIASN